MLRHRGKGRNYLHNLKLASILSAVAGIVNITGVLGLKTLTTNVTGHFAFFSEEFFLKNYGMAFIYLIYIFSFLCGAFVSNTVMELVSKFRPHTSYVLPIAIEISVLTFVACSDILRISNLTFAPMYLSCALLFAMGLQNALVTTVSQSVVRTTHLTGLFTDLGIELSQLLFCKGGVERKRLNKSLLLKAAIIGCFFSGGMIGSLAFFGLGLKTLFIPIGLLLFNIWYDRLLLRYYNVKRKLRHND